MTSLPCQFSTNVFYSLTEQLTQTFMHVLGNEAAWLALVQQAAGM